MKRFLDEANEAYPTLGLAPDDVSVVNTGLILFAENREETEKISFGHRSILLDHEAKHKVGGLITLIGVRATTARGMGAKAVNLVLRKLGKPPSRSKTETTPIFGGRIEHFDGFLEQLRRQRPHGLEDGVLEQLVHNYGSEHQEVLKYIQESPELGARLGDTMVIGAEIVHAVREEMAGALGDVVYRRTDLGTGRSPGSAALSECARIMAKEAGWDEERTKEETEEVRRYFVRHGATAEGRTAVNAG
jgi:glycerol-3-phosphate dehydrogenase